MNRRNIIENPKIFIFDWDGTIIDSHKVIILALKKTLLKFNIKSDKIIEEITLKPISTRESFPLIFKNNAKEAEDFYKKQYLINHLKLITIDENIYQFIEYLYQNNVKLYILSNKTGGILRKEVEFLFKKKYFTKIIGSYDYDCDKPNKKIIYHLISNFSDKLNNIYYIGDSIVDINLISKCDNIEMILYQNRDNIDLQKKEVNNSKIIQVGSYAELLKMIKFKNKA